MICFVYSRWTPGELRSRVKNRRNISSPCAFPQHLTSPVAPPPLGGCWKPLSGKLSRRCTHRRAQVSAGVGKPPHGLGACIWMPLVNGTGNSPSPGRPTPGVVKRDKSSGGSVDTTKTRSGPQRVRMSSGERPIGAAKGKQPDTEALCHPPPPPERVCRGCRIGHQARLRWLSQWWTIATGASSPPLLEDNSLQPPPPPPRYSLV